MHELDAIATSVEEHEQATVSDIELKIVFDNPKESVKALACIDGLSVKINLDRGTEREHLSDLTKNVRQRINGLDRNEDRNSVGESHFNRGRSLIRSLDL